MSEEKDKSKISDITSRNVLKLLVFYQIRKIDFTMIHSVIVLNYTATASFTSK